MPINVPKSETKDENRMDIYIALGLSSVLQRNPSPSPSSHYFLVFPPNKWVEERSKSSLSPFVLASTPFRPTTNLNPLFLLAREEQIRYLSQGASLPLPPPYFCLSQTFSRERTVSSKKLTSSESSVQWTSPSSSSTTSKEILVSISMAQTTLSPS